MFFALSRRGQQQYGISSLVAASLFFYGWWNPSYVLLIFASAFGNYCFGLVLSQRRPTGTRRFFFIAGITCNLLLLGYFKYVNFFLNNVNALAGTSFHPQAILLPLGVSFFTFQQLAYIVDVYRGESGERNFLRYCLFVTFFPKLIAGPIVYQREFLPQFSMPAMYRFNSDNLAEGLTIFLLGLFKKVVIADMLAQFADPVFTAVNSGVMPSPSFFVAWQGALAFTLQIYFDFSAYSDMAIGVSRMFGITLPVNFNSPYKAANIREFWSRWHITLSRFLRDYIYIPLGGNRKGTIRQYMNLMITMLICGLWHGAGWTFVAWGALHAVYLVVNHGWNKIKVVLAIRPQGVNRPGLWCGRLLTFSAVITGWVLFRAESFSSAVALLKGMTGLNGAVLPSQILNLIPPLKVLVKPAGTVPFLAGGTVMGVIQFLLITLTCLIIVFFSKNLYELNLRQRIYLLVPSFAFVFQAILFGRMPSDFIYFKF